MRWNRKRIPTVMESTFMLDNGERVYGFVYIFAIEDKNGNTRLQLGDDDDYDVLLSEGLSYEFYSSVVNSVVIWNYEHYGYKPGDSCPVTNQRGW